MGLHPDIYLVRVASEGISGSSPSSLPPLTKLQSLSTWAMPCACDSGRRHKTVSEFPGCLCSSHHGKGPN